MSVRKCNCGAGSRVIETDEIHFAVRRRRVCRNCGLRWTTYEISKDTYDSLAELFPPLPPSQSVAELVESFKKRNPNVKLHLTE